MIRFIAIVLLGVSQLVQAGTLDLFDGESLAGWQAVGDAQWSVVDQALVASGTGDGLLVTDKEY